MMNYEKLVEALRCENTGDDECGSSDCPYWSGLGCMDGQLMEDAADAIEKLVTLYEKTEMDATNLTGKLAQAEADVERMNLEIDKRIATEIELSKSLDAANHQLKMHSMYPFDDEED